LIHFEIEDEMMSGQFQMLQKSSVQPAPSFPSALSRGIFRQRKSAGVGTPGRAVAPPIVHETLRTPGQPLDAGTKGFMEPRFGHKFDQVRVHTGDRAAESAQAVNATAYTVGNQVVFGRGRYQPSSAEGRHLLAHELAHVVQQAGTAENPARQIEVGEPDTTSEVQAEQVARTISLSPSGSGGQTLGGSGMMLQRQDKPAQTAAVPAECTAYEPDSKAVDNIIQNALGGSRSQTYKADDLQIAWYNVRQQREKSDGSNCCSAELAAAEHYMYARYSVTHKDHAPGEMKIMIWTYGYFKFLVPKTGICPKSPDTQGSRDWGYKGVDDAVNVDLFHENLN
jgi:hypothetical protein